MPAVVQISRLTGSGPTNNTITSSNARVDASDNQSTAETSYPITIPVTGTNYSYWCSTQLDCTTAPSTMINNIRWYTSGTNNLGTGIDCYVGQATSYVQATGSTGTGNVLNTTNYSSLTGSPVEAFSNYTSGSPLSVTGSTSTTGLFGNIVVYQFTVSSTASPGASGQPTFTWLYDEY